MVATTSAADIARPTQRLRRALAIAFVVGVMLLHAGTDYFGGREPSRIVARLGFMTVELPILMIAMSSVFERAVRGRITTGQAVAAGVAAATLIGSVFGLLYAAVSSRYPSLRLTFPYGVSFVRLALFWVLNAYLYSGLWALAFVYPFALESARVRALEAQQLRSEADLARLRAHLEPHFMLNTLNAIAGLVTEEPKEARRLLSCLGDLLRDAVASADETQRLDEQIAWLRRYAQILETRHRGALRFRWEIAPGTEGLVLPRLLLQPLVENAVKHGALQREDRAGEVVIRTSQDAGGLLVCAIEDNGPGIADREVRDGAFGLMSVRRRLELEARGGTLAFESTAGGTRSVVTLAALRG